MKAIILKKPGGVQNLIYTDIQEPSIKDNEVLVKVEAISINPVDTGTRSNAELLNWIVGDTRPVILGWDISGAIVKKGERVRHFEIGDAVFGMVNFMGVGNAYAEYVAVPADQLAKKPANTTYEEAAVTTLAALTALQSLEKNIKKGDKVLIHAGSGGVGHFAIQIAKHLGAYVITTCSEKNKEFVLSLGVDEHIDYSKLKFNEIISNIDFVLDTIGAEVLNDSLDVLKPGGTVVALRSVGFSDDLIQKANQLNVKLQSLLVQSNGDDMNTLKRLLENQVIKPYISARFQFDKMADAHLQIETNRTVGKIVVIF